MSYDNTARLWDVRDGACLGVMQHGGPVTRAQFSADGRLIVTASADNTATLWRCDQAGKPRAVHYLKVSFFFGSVFEDWLGHDEAGESGDPREDSFDSGF